MECLTKKELIKANHESVVDLYLETAKTLETSLAIIESKKELERKKLRFSFEMAKAKYQVRRVR